MIYKIHGNKLSEALSAGGSLIVFSFDGTFALVKSNEPLSNVLEMYDDSSLSILFNDPLYKQPCKDC